MVISKYFAEVDGWIIWLLNVKSIEDLSLALGIERCNWGVIIRAIVLAVLTTKLFTCIYWETLKSFKLVNICTSDNNFPEMSSAVSYT